MDPKNKLPRKKWGGGSKKSKCQKNRVAAPSEGEVWKILSGTKMGKKGS